MRQLGEEFRDLEACYKASTARRWNGRKASVGESEDRRMLLEHLASEIEEVKTLQKRQYMKGYKQPSRNIPSMTNAPLFSNPDRESTISVSLEEDISAGQRQALLTIKEREAAFESAISQIGNGVEDLKDLALRQNEEVKMQNVMLSDMADRMDVVSSKMHNINSRMKETLRNVSRGGDKLCIDIFCVLLALGLFGVVWKQNDLRELF
jgi:methyl-accepting chemotaxis protein